MLHKPDLIPMPRQQRRGIVRWVLLIIHVIPFAVLIFGYPLIYEQFPDVMEDNLIKLLIPAWSGLILLHLLLAAFLDMREGLVYGRREKQRRSLYIKARQGKPDNHELTCWGGHPGEEKTL